MIFSTKRITLLSVCFSLCLSVFAQETEGVQKIVPKEFAIPASPIFDMMGVVPSSVNRPDDIKDFKVDWSFKSWRLNPNLAIQAQPVWEILYNRSDLEKYQKATPFMRKLASLDISAGTVVNEENDRRIGYAAKINLYNQYDPLMATELYSDISEKYKQEKRDLIDEMNELQNQLDTMTNILEKPTVRNNLSAATDNYNTLNSRRNAEISERAKIYKAEHWNSASLDVAFGRIYTYATDSAGSLKSLKLNRNTAWSLWLNGSLPIGKKIQISGLIRNSWYSENLAFTLINDETMEESEHSEVAQNTLLSIGANIRYGGVKYSFFAEYLSERKSTKTALAALKEVFSGIEGFTLEEKAVKWTVVHPTVISLGGDWLINRSVVINYGVKCIIDKEFKTRAFVPVVGISCMMR